MLSFAGAIMNYSEWLENTKRVHLELKTSLGTDKGTATYIDSELLLKEFELHVNLVKHYLDLVIKFNVFYYAVTGALLSYYFTNFKTDNFIKWSLALPILMSFFFGILFVAASRAIPQVDEEITYISTLLGFAKPEVRVLRFALIASGLLFIGIGIVLSIVFIVKT